MNHLPDERQYKVCSDSNLGKGETFKFILIKYLLLQLILNTLLNETEETSLKNILDLEYYQQLVH